MSGDVRRDMAERGTEVRSAADLRSAAVLSQLAGVQVHCRRELLAATTRHANRERGWVVVRLPGFREIEVHPSNFSHVSGHDEKLNYYVDGVGVGFLRLTDALAAAERGPAGAEPEGSER